MDNNIGLLLRNFDGRKLKILCALPFKELIGNIEYSRREINNNQGYQRQLDDKRLNQIKKNIFHKIKLEIEGNQKQCIFPSSIILSLNNEEIDIEDSKTTIEMHKVVNNNKFFVVDGQHRFESFKQLYDQSSDSKVKYWIENYKFNCVLLLNFDLWEEALIFSDINFHQKPVNKSMFYDLFGIMYNENLPKEYSSIYLAHIIVQFMQKTPLSPFNNKIKMLGTGFGFISQAALVNAILPLFKKESIWFNAYVQYEQNKSKKSIKWLPFELIAFFDSVKITFNNSWPTDNQDNIKSSIIYKTTGVGALIKLMEQLHNKIDVNSFNNYIDRFNDSDFVFLKTQYTELLKPLKTYEDELFGEDSEYAHSGGQGLVKKLYNRMKSIIAEYNEESFFLLYK